MKIGIVCYPTYGGSGVLATELGKALAQKGHQVHFIAHNQPVRLTDFVDNVYYHEVSFTNYPLFEFPPYETALASKLVDTVKFYKLDILHVHYAIPHASAAYMARTILQEQGIYIPIITTLHGTDITLVGKDATFAPVVTFSINQSDGVTAVSDSLRQQTHDFFDIKRPIKVIPNFVDLHKFSRSDKQHFRQAIAPHNEHLVVHTSNFRRVKRIDDVIDTFKLILDNTLAKLLLIGDGPERIKAEQKCRDMHICDHVRFLGKQDAIGELLSISDLFLMPSESESFGLAALEAMACEVPIISTDVGGIPEVNLHGITGFLSKVGDVQDMAKNALYILKSPEILAQFRQNALAQAQTFSIDKILPQYEQYYEQICEQSHAH
jgi:N-acetyl-alpha-D-glucosaminyl L-malate synthase BshA